MPRAATTPLFGILILQSCLLPPNYLVVTNRHLRIESAHNLVSQEVRTFRQSRPRSNSGPKLLETEDRCSDG